MASNNINPMQLIGMMRNSNNPNDFVINMLEQYGGNGNPIMKNLIELAKKGDSSGIEQIARNILKERGFDFEKEFKDFKQQLGL